MSRLPSLGSTRIRGTGRVGDRARPARGHHGDTTEHHQPLPPELCGVAPHHAGSILLQRVLCSRASHRVVVFEAKWHDPVHEEYHQEAEPVVTCPGHCRSTIYDKCVTSNHAGLVHVCKACAVALYSPGHISSSVKQQYKEICLLPCSEGAFRKLISYEVEHHIGYE